MSQTLRESTNASDTLLIHEEQVCADLLVKASSFPLEYIMSSDKNTVQAVPISASNDTTTSPSALSWAIAILVLGSSAGFTLYTKKTGSMLSRMKHMEKVRLERHPPKQGPPTQKEYEKMKPRIDKDEFF